MLRLLNNSLVVNHTKKRCFNEIFVLNLNLKKKKKNCVSLHTQYQHKTHTRQRLLYHQFIILYSYNIYNLLRSTYSNHASHSSSIISVMVGRSSTSLINIFRIKFKLLSLMTYGILKSPSIISSTL